MTTKINAQVDFVRTVNVTRLFRTATTAERAAGARWYGEALELAEDLAYMASVPVSTAVGVIAATSPLNNWQGNVKLAKRILSTGDTSRGYLTVGLNKARAILDGADPLEILTSQKVGNFYRAIVSAGVDGVCIDRHAYDIAVNRRHTDATRPGVSGKRYDTVAECYRKAAVILSKGEGNVYSAAQVQATTWTLWRRKYWNAGAYDALPDSTPLDGLELDDIIRANS